MTACSASVLRVEEASAPRAGTRQRALTGPTWIEVEMAQKPLCTIEGCDKPARKRGWCNMHYEKWRRHGDPLGGRSIAPRGSVAAWLYEHSGHTGDDCLTWPFSRNRHGYGRVHTGTKNTTASRVMCEIAHGAPPSPAHQAAHSCGMGHMGCVNPKHLRWAMPDENAADMLAHGTRNRGERNGVSKLTKADVRRIKALAGRLSQPKIGEMFGIHVQTVGRILRGHRWGWLK